MYDNNVEGMGGLEVDVAARSMVASTVIFYAGFNSRVVTILCCCCVRRFLAVRRFLTVYGSRFSLTAFGGSYGGLIMFLHLVGGSRVPHGIRPGWD